MFKFTNPFQTKPERAAKENPPNVEMPLVELSDAFPELDEEPSKSDVTDPLLFKAASSDIDDVDPSIIEIRVKTDVKDFNSASLAAEEVLYEPETETIEQESYIRTEYCDSNRFTFQEPFLTAARFIVSVDHGLYHGKVRDESSIRGNLFLPNDVMFDEVFEKDNVFQAAPEGVTPEVPQEKLRFEFI